MNFSFYKKKIIIGTAQFIPNYGLKNEKKFINSRYFLNFLHKKNLKYLDTAQAYNNAEELIGATNNEYYVTTKISEFNNSNLNNSIIDKVSQSLKKLKLQKIYCLIIHHGEDLLKKNGKYIYKSLISLKNIGIIDKIGISMYDEKKTAKILKKYKIDVIQFPFNVFDQRLIHSGLLRLIKKKKVEIHVRSIFLQGLLLIKKNKLPKYFCKWENQWKNWHHWLKKNKIDALTACLSYCLSFKNIDKFVIGVNNVKQLKIILNSKIRNNFLIPQNLSINDQKIINPVNWKN